ncbi:Tn3 family transposase [Streptomyces atratus]|uniref:Tn3 family transposase n=1 Tax=Streptomyces TaxID=1883 RepID=UPI0037A57A67
MKGRTRHNALDIAEIVRQLLDEGWTIEPEDLAHISPCLSEHINRFGKYSTHEFGIRPRRTTTRAECRPHSLHEQDPNPPPPAGDLPSQARHVTRTAPPWPWRYRTGVS